MEYFKTVFSDRLKVIMKELDLIQADLGFATGISKQSLSLILNNSNKPSYDAIQQIILYLLKRGVKHEKIIWLLTEQKKKEPTTEKNEQTFFDNIPTEFMSNYIGMSQKQLI